MNELLHQAENWLAQDPDPVTRAELRKLIDAKDFSALSERFSKRLEFGTAGLRGELGAGPNRMNRVLVSQAAAGLGRYLNSGASVVIGFDGRINSEIFAKDSAEILSGIGLKVFLLDRICPTPLISFATRYLNASAGIMVTASHNPPRDNGYKVYLGGAFNGSQIIAPVDSEIAAAIELVAKTETFDSLPKSANYEVVGNALREAYVDSVLASSQYLESLPIKIAYTAMHGVGYLLTEEIFTKAGFTDLHAVTEQIAPDGNFPTVSFPNPEEKGAMDLVLAKAKQVQADIVIAQDPDADRLAVAIHQAGQFIQLTGDQVGLILADEIAKRHSVGTLASSIVSCSALSKVAEHYGLKYQSTLTGFKWISKVPNLIFGYEEALGYCIDPNRVADKDGISSALMIVKIAARELAEGRTLLDLLEELGDRYGHFATAQISLRFENLQRVTGLMHTLRQSPPQELLQQRVRFTDLSLGSAELPATDGLRLDLADQSRVIIRPSGTEPKLKCYLQVIGENSAAAKAKIELLAKDVGEFLSDLD